jgi:hypothetical protein
MRAATELKATIWIPFALCLVQAILALCLVHLITSAEARWTAMLLWLSFAIVLGALFGALSAESRPRTPADEGSGYGSEGLLPPRLPSLGSERRN